MKAITRRDLPDEPIIGLHYVGPNAGEVMQGFGVAMKAGLTKSELQNYEFIRFMIKFYFQKLLIILLVFIQ